MDGGWVGVGLYREGGETEDTKLKKRRWHGAKMVKGNRSQSRREIAYDASRLHQK